MWMLHWNVIWSSSKKSAWMNEKKKVKKSSFKEWINVLSLKVIILRKNKISYAVDFWYWKFSEWFSYFLATTKFNFIDLITMWTHDTPIKKNLFFFIAYSLNSFRSQKLWTLEINDIILLKLFFFVISLRLNQKFVRQWYRFYMHPIFYGC